MIERKWKPENHKLEEAFFPVELCDLKFVYPAERDLFGSVVRTEDVLAKEHKAVVDINKCHVFATVTDKYKLVTNEDAYKWAEPVVGAVFNHSQLKNFDCFNVRMTATRERIGEIRSLEDQFIAKLRNLKKHSVPQNVMLALACKVFNLHLTRDDAESMSAAERKKAVAFVQKIKSDAQDYYQQFGANAYAAMNVLTDFASYPKGLSGVNTVPVLQAKAGAWIDDFVEASAQPGFNMTSYLGVDAIEAATWYDSLTAA